MNHAHATALPVPPLPSEKSAPSGWAWKSSTRSVVMARHGSTNSAKYAALDCAPGVDAYGRPKRAGGRRAGFALGALHGAREGGTGRKPGREILGSGESGGRRQNRAPAEGSHRQKSPYI